MFWLFLFYFFPHRIRLGNLKKMTMNNFSKSMKYTRAAGEGADVIQEEDSRADTR